MATALYRLGRLAARRALWVVAAWALVLSALGAAAFSVGASPAGDMSIPGTEFQTVVDDLKAAMPETAGASAGVVFSSADGTPFTASQRQAVADLLARWQATDEVDSATNPFSTQATLDAATKKITDAGQSITDGRVTIRTNAAKLTDAATRITDGERALDLNSGKLASGLTALNAGQSQLDAGRVTLEANAAKIAAGLRSVTQGETQLADGRRQLAAAADQVRTATQQVSAAQAQLAQRHATLTAEKASLDQLAAERGESDPEVIVAREKAAADEAEAATSEKALAARSAQLAGSQKTLTAQQAELRAGATQLAAARARLDAGSTQIEQARTKLAAGQATIAQNRAKIQSGTATIADARTRLARARTQIAEGKTALATATAKLTTGAADLARGERRLALSSEFRTVGTKGTVALATLKFTASSIDNVPTEFKEELGAQASSLAPLGINLDLDDQLVDKAENGSSEAVGIGIAGVVLLVMFGSMLAAGLPLVTAIVGIGVGILGATVIGHFVPMTSVTTILALMLGLAVGIDYALFLVNRHRRQLAAGVELIESIGLACGTAGSAVVFAGTTVVVALAALTLTGIPWLGLMGLVAAGTVAIAVLVSITLTPALLALIGPRVLSRTVRRALATEASASSASSAPSASSVSPVSPAVQDDSRYAGRGTGWGGLVTRHPLITLVAGALLLGVLAVPAASLRLGLPDGSQAAHASTGYRAYTLIADNFGPGRNGTIVAVAKLDSDAAQELTTNQLDDLEVNVASRLAATPGVDYAMPAGHSADRQTLVFSITPQTGPSEEATASLVHTLRADRGTILARNHLTSLGFAGATVANIDIAQRLSDALPGYLAVVVGISVLLMLIVFRSLLVPLVATAGFLLSVAAAFGASVAVYQWGWLGSVFGVETPAPLLAFLPILAIGILFGLAMDYQVFLVSGMREALIQGDSPLVAVRRGFGQGSRVITAAALIMTAVFASFLLSPIPLVKPIGFILTAGVLFDAFVVRMTLVPAVLGMLGKHAWYLPRWLDQLLPHLDVEGAALHRPARTPRPRAATLRPEVAWGSEA